MTAANLLVVDGRLSAVIDFGCSGRRRPGLRYGDRLDVLLRRAGPRSEGLALDEATWARGRGWALWKALITLVRMRAAADVRDPAARFGWRVGTGEVVEEVLAGQ